ncbi:MAG: hypothetical protein ABRQ39_31945 [Candidatus Eremiobacterota bacterium]
MKKTYFLMAMLFVGLMVVPALGFTPTIDADLSEWGLSKLLTDDWAINETWLPMNGISFIVEDNKDPRWGTPSGVHITGTGAVFNAFYEDKVMTRKGGPFPEPIGGEPYDLEAFYLGEDTTTVYVAVVTSVDPSLRGQYLPGDLAINADWNSGTGEFGYEYGIVFGEEGIYPQGTIVYLPDWEGKGDVIPPNVDVVIGVLPGGSISAVPASIAYNNNWMTITDNGKPNYVIEVGIPKNTIGMNGVSPHLKQFRISENCINDSIIIPEFPTLAVSISMILGLLFCISHIKQRKID